MALCSGIVFSYRFQVGERENSHLLLTASQYKGQIALGHFPFAHTWPSDFPQAVEWRCGEQRDN